MTVCWASSLTICAYRAHFYLSMSTYRLFIFIVHSVVDFTDSMCLEVANDQVIGQCLLVVKSLEEVRWAACLLLCLSRCREAHANLLKPDVIETLVAWDEANRADIKSETVATR